MRISVIVPVYNGGACFSETLSSVLREADGLGEVIVVSDASTDGSDRLAEKLGARVVRLPENAGPSAARNRGSREATGDLLVFVDADVSLPAGALWRMKALFEGPDAPDAAFGSYDDEPASEGFASQYRNLLHHHVHQEGRPDASTFWAGFGAVRREAFNEIGGFDESRRWLEDVDLGGRMVEAGARIRLERSLQAKHHKRWTLATMLWTDVVHRAYPWTELIWKSGQMPKDLNLRSSCRWAACLVLTFPLWASGIVFASGAWRAIGAVGLGLSIATQAVLDAPLYAFFRRKRGVLFMLRGILCHWIYYASATITFAATIASFVVTRRSRKKSTVIPGWVPGSPAE